MEGFKNIGVNVVIENKLVQLVTYLNSFHNSFLKNSKKIEFLKWTRNDFCSVTFIIIKQDQP